MAMPTIVVTVNVGRAGAASLDVIQEVEYVKQEAKVIYLLECLQKTPPPVSEWVWCKWKYSACLCCQVLIFSEKKAEVDDIHEYLLLKGVQTVSIHGSKGRCVLKSPSLPPLDVGVVLFAAQIKRIDSGPFESSGSPGRMSWWLLILHPKASISLTSNTLLTMICQQTSRTMVCHVTMYDHVM